MPRMRPASRSGWKTSSASVFSPVPMNLTGTPVTALMDSAAPPRASPSILVRMRPVMATASRNASATGTASWPTMASTTSSVSVGCTTWATPRISAMSASSTLSRPAVSRMTTSRPVRFASAMPPRAMSTTAVPGRRAVDRDVQGRAEGLELVHGGGSIRVRGDEQRLPALAHDVPGELGGRRGLAGALESHERDDRGRPVQPEGPVAGAQDRGQLVMDDLDDELAGVDAFQHVLADGPFLDPADEVLDDLVVDVGFQEREADLAHGGIDVGLGDPATAGELAKDIAQAVAECIEHGTRQCSRGRVRVAGLARAALRSRGRGSAVPNAPSDGPTWTIRPSGRRRSARLSRDDPADWSADRRIGTLGSSVGPCGREHVSRLRIPSAPDRPRRGDIAPRRATSRHIAPRAEVCLTRRGGGRAGSGSPATACAPRSSGTDATHPRAAAIAAAEVSGPSDSASRAAMMSARSADGHTSGRPRPISR